MTDYKRIIMIACAAALVDATCMAAEQPTVEPAAAEPTAVEPTAEELAAEEEPKSLFGAGQQSVAAAYKQIDIINIDEAVLEKGRLTLLKGNVKIAFIPRDPPDPPDPLDPPAPPDPPVTLQADGAEFIYETDIDTMPSKVVTQGRVIIIQGENRFATDHATWFRDEAKVVCEGNVEISYGDSKMYADSIVHYLIEERTEVTGNVRGTVIPPPPPPEEIPEETTETVQEPAP